MTTSTIQTVRLPCGEAVPALGQGTWMMGEDPALKAQEIASLRAGLDHGLSLIDTAEMYGEGRTETLVGEAISGRQEEHAMTSRIQARLAELGVTLPAAPSPAANYLPAVRTGNLLFIAGQVPVQDGKPQFLGQLGATLSVEEGQNAARLCAINVLAQAAQALGGDLDRVVRCVRVGGFVNAVPQFTEHPKVVNGASDFFVSVFGEAGKHARTAVGAGSLPRGVAVEVDAVFEIRD